MNAMKFYANTMLALGMLAVSSTGLWSQRKVCGFDESFQQSLQNDPRARAEYERCERLYENAVLSNQRTAGGVRTIPCVVHVIQTSAQEIVTPAIVQSQLDVLNEDFRRMAGTPGFGNGVDMLYEFCLASIDPNGAPTTGINRVISPTLAFHDKADEAQFKGLIQWDPYRYFNIWVARTIETTSGAGQVIGYATFPSSISFQGNLDGVVIHSGYFGRDSDPSTIGRTTTHEVGHWIGLFHTFQNGCQGSSAGTCLTGGDRVCDTPQAFDQNFGCPSRNSCTDTPTDLPDQIENYMDYSDGTCQNMYTNGQKVRSDQIMANYRSQIYSPANLTATGCDGTPAPGAVPVANFQADHRYVCVNQPVNFTETSYGGTTQWNWTFQGGSPGNATIQNPQVIYNTPGIYSVTLSTATNFGTDSEVKASYIHVLSPVGPAVSEGFEGLTSGLPTGWTAIDNDQIGSWSLLSTTGAQGSGKCLKVAGYNTYSAGLSDDLVLPPTDFSSVVTANLTYDWSYRKRSGFIYDSLQVLISTDCGTTWSVLKTRVQNTLVTVGGLQASTEYVPTVASQWKSDTIDLSAYAGMPSIRLQFKAIGYDGQSMYLDNININSTLVGVGEQAWNPAEFMVSPNPFRDEFNVHYQLRKAGSTRLTLVDAAGKLVYTMNTGTESAGIHHIAVDAASVRQLPAGIYFLKAEGPNGSATRKLVKMD